MPGRSYLQELRDFLKFLLNLWGLLAGVSLFFPLSNLLADVIPIDEDGEPFRHLAPETLTAVTMIVCIFTTFAIFQRRKQFLDQAKSARHIRSARISFAIAIICGGAYLLCRSFAYNGIIELDTGTEYSTYEFNYSLYEGAFAVLYIGCFALLTRAFLLLALVEYKRSEESDEADRQTPQSP